MDRSPPRGGAHRANRPVGQLVHRFRHADGRHSRGASRVRGPVLVSLAVWTLLFKTPPPLRLRCSLSPLLLWGPRSRRMPRESLDAPEHLAKEAPGQVTFGQLEDEVPGMPDEVSARLA